MIVSHPLLFTKPIKVKRFLQGTYILGEYKRGQINEFTIDASVQPHRNLELLQEQLGRRVRKAVKIYNDQKELLTAKTSPSEKADRIIWKGETYEIHESLDHNHLLPHYKAIGVLMDSQELEECDE